MRLRAPGNVENLVTARKARADDCRVACSAVAGGGRVHADAGAGALGILYSSKPASAALPVISFGQPTDRFPSTKVLQCLG